MVKVKVKLWTGFATDFLILTMLVEFA